MGKNILICVLGGKGWLGGVYYIKNLLFQLSISNEAQNKYHYFMLIQNDIIDEFQEFIKSMKIYVIKCSKTADLQEQLLLTCTDYNIDVVLPVQGGGYTWLINNICLYWIPDLQEIHLPENFSADELELRKRIRSYIAEEHKGLILSSSDAYNDYKSLYPQNLDNVFVAHFVSYIKPMVEAMSDSFEKEIINKYGIRYDYIFVSNQFWRHKNHIVVLKAINKIVHEREEKIHLVCTGLMESYGRTDEYTKSLFRYVEEHNIQEYVHFLGLLERKEQLCLMKNARMLIQPSKFEGWGCSVEDGKVMGKKILLSDINVHKEQQYLKSELFPQDDYKILADIILNKFWNIPKYDLEYGNKYVMQKALEYSEELQKAIDAIQTFEKKDYLDELERRRKEKMVQLFGDLKQDQICIYGIGRCTEKLIESCQRVFGNSNFIYSDSDERKWGIDFGHGKVYSPSCLLKLGIKRIVISSIKYQEEIYQSLKEIEDDIDIVKIYNSSKELNEILWL